MIRIYLVLFVLLFQTGCGGGSGPESSKNIPQQSPISNQTKDSDNDGIIDTQDAFPLDARETLDTDGDGIGNNADLDDDNDGINDAQDAFPLDPSETLDSDGDNIGDNADPDDDNDGVNDEQDAFPNDARRQMFIVSGEVTGSAARLALSLGGKTLQVRDGGFSFELEKGAEFTLSVSSIAANQYCTYDAKALIADRDIADLYIDCFDGLRLSELLPTIPDSNFRACLREKTGGYVYAHQVTELSCTLLDIQSAEGLEQFRGLTILDLSHNPLTLLDLSGNTALLELDISWTPLVNMDLSYNVLLVDLSLQYNQLSDLDVSANTALKRLLLSKNKLTRVDLSSNTALKTLSLYENDLSNVDLSTNTLLETLLIYNNKLTSIDVSKTPN
ncbi:MAG: hypothetical protein JKY50_16735 [Oleispira sp.]|nr:hypothetical protein [Oleispira sp.]MBL4882557.1 hypothetical protein [Oleispira sp.]